MSNLIGELDRIFTNILELYRNKRYSVFTKLAVVFTIYGSLITISVGGTDKKESPAFKCNQVAEDEIKIDGLLNEKCWKEAPVMEFLDLVDGSRHPITSYGRIVWDNKYIYIAYQVNDSICRGVLWSKKAWRKSS